MQTSCEIVTEAGDLQIQPLEETARLNLRLAGTGGTRSSISPDENRIREICVMVYSMDNGKLVSMQTAGSTAEIDIDLTQGEYNIYVTANMGEFDAPVNESDISRACHVIDSFEGLGSGLPMSWSGHAALKAGTVTTVTADLERLVSKVGLDVEMGVLEGLEITSVRLRQGAATIRPFMQGGNRITSRNEIMDGDYATDTDIKALMNGETMYFYVTENCQGTLLPGNSDPWSKVPDSIGETAGLCTYIEMNGKWNDKADYEGEVTYRFYIGEDATSNFDIRRNSLQNLTLYLEEDSFDRISWKIDASRMDVVRWTVRADLSQNFHSKDDLYVTENIKIAIQFDERGQRYWKKRDNRFSVVGMDYGGNTLISFGQAVDLGGGRFEAMGTCLDDGDFDLLLVNDATGGLEYIMDYGTVKIPEITAGYNGTFSDIPVEGYDEETELMINGDKKEIFLYLTDSRGYNLNQSRYYGCDLSICDWNIDLRHSDYSFSLSDMADLSSETGTTGSDSYALRFTLGISNDGKDESWNERLTQSLGRGTIGLVYEDITSGASGRHSMGLYCDDITVTFRPVPDNKKAILQSEFMYVTDNPSNLPLLVRGIKLNSLTGVPFRSDIRPVLCNAFPGYTETDPLLVSRMPYTYCSVEPSDDETCRSIIDGKLCFAADDRGIEQAVIPNQMAMFHNFEVEFGYDSEYWVPKFTGIIDLYDTPAHATLYGKDGYMNCGAVFHDYSSSYELFDGNNGLKTDFSGYGDLLGKDAIRLFDNIVTLDLSINEDNQIVASASRTVELNISLSGTLNGHIRCVTVQDPFYTIWGHYFTHAQNFSNPGTFSVGTTPVVIDDSALADAFSKMRDIPYYSVLDAWDVDDFRNPNSLTDSVREYLKPASIDLAVNISSTRGLPVAVRFSGSTKYEYTISKPVTWAIGLFSSVTMVPSSHSGFDNRLDDDDCPPGALFAAETLYLQPNITLNQAHGIYYMVP